MPIIKDIVMEDIPAIQRVSRSNTTIGADDGDRPKNKRKRSKKSEKRDVETTKDTSIKNEQNCPMRVYKMEIGIDSSRVTNEMTTYVAELIGRTTPTPQALLSTLATTDATVDASTSDTTKTTDDENGAYSEAPHIDTL